ncbi:MAG: hypothetical protein OER88_01610 [Planctomycetota bacterium]|nr:hypothetical protein [Planctomycetota bacterium]
MGTFHDDKGELHGMTVVVETNGPRVYIGRCDTQTPEGIVLLDADHHDEGQDGKSNDDYLSFAAKYGVFKKHDHIVVPAAEITTVRRLGELA